MRKNLSRVARRWSKTEPDLSTSFFGFRPLRPYLIETAFGKYLANQHQDNRFWAEDIVVSEYLTNKKIESVLSICCGFGHVERRIVSQLPYAKECIGVDVAEGALEVARRRAASAGLSNLSYQRADLNSYDWEQDRYDLVLANGALHHLSNLEGVLEGIRGALRADGTLYANEHVGASYQEYPVRQLELINAAAYLVPPELRERRGLRFRGSGRVAVLCRKLHNIADPQDRPQWSTRKKLVAAMLRKVFRPPKGFNFGIVHVSQKKYLLRTDPSEGVRSSEIIPLIQNYFDEVEIHPYGGGIVSYALDRRFYESYDQNNPLHRETLDMLCELERYYMETGEIGMEHAIIIAKKR